MSKQIDERVLSLKCDNTSFNAKIAKTIQALGSLEDKLSLKKSKNGMEDLQKTANRFSLNPLQVAADKTANKFSALKIAGITAIMNIANSATNYGKQIVKSLTIDPIKSGWNEYELKMGSVQTIMAGTGESLDTVNQALNALNKYSDQTIYSFQDMTSNIGKFTNAGVKLDDAVAAIKGVANEAALAGANSNEASRAMYNFAQALSAGYVKLIDWKSIENANMATVSFKNELLKTASAVGTVKKQADGMYKVLTTNAQGHVMEQTIDATHNFNDSLQQQWMTSEVLTKTLSKYADETSEIGKKATKAATEIKTGTMMLDTLREAAQSGWAQTWELVIGDFEEGKNLWTSIGNTISGLLDKMSDARNSFIADSWSTGYQRLTKELENAGVSADSFKLKMIKVSGVAKGTDKELLSLANDTEFMKKHLSNWTKDGTMVKAFNDITSSLTKMSDTELKNYSYTEDHIKAIRSFGDASSDTNKNIKDIISTLGELSGKENLIEGFKNIFKVINLYLEKIEKSFKNVFKAVKPKQFKDLLKTFKEFTDNLLVGEKAAKRNLKLLPKIEDTFTGLFSAIDIVKDIIWEIAKTVLPEFTDGVEIGGNGILSMTAFIGRNITKLHEWIEEHDAITKTFDKVRKIIASVKDAISNLISFIDKLINKIKNLESVKMVVEGLKNTFDKLSNTFDNLISKIKDITSNKNETGLSKIKNIFGEIFNTIKNGLPDIDTFVSKLDTFFSDSLIKIDSLNDKFYDFIKKLTNIETTEIVLEQKHSSNGDNRFDDDKLGKTKDTASSVFEKAKNNLAELADSGIFEKLFAMGSVGSLLKITKSLSSTLQNLSGPLGAFNNLIVQISGTLVAFKKVLLAMRLDIFAVAAIEFSVAVLLLAGALWVLAQVPIDRLADVSLILLGLISVVAVLVVAVGFLTAKANAVKGTGVLNAIAVMALTVLAFIPLLLAIKVLGDNTINYAKVERGIDDLIKLLVTMTAAIAVILIMGKIAGEGVSLNLLSVASVLVGAAAAILLVAIALKKIDEIEVSWETIGKLALVMALSAVISEIGIIMSSHVKDYKALTASAVYLALASMSMLVVIKVINKINEAPFSASWELAGKLAAVAFFSISLAEVAKILGENKAGYLSALSAVTTLVGFSLAIIVMLAAMDKVIAAISKLVDEHGIAGTIGYITGAMAIVTVLGLLCSLLVHVAGKIEKAKLADAGILLLSAAGTIMILSIVAVALATISKLDGLITGAAIVIFLTASVSALFYALSKMADSFKSSDVDKINKLLTKIMATLVIMSIINVILAKTTEVTPAIAATILLSVLMGAIAVSLRIVSKIQNDVDLSLKVLASIVGAVLAMTVVSMLLGKMNTDLSTALSSAIIMGILMLALGKTIDIMSKMQSNINDCIKVAVAMVIIVGAMCLTYQLMSSVDPERMVAIAVALGIWVAAFAGLSALISYFPGISTGIQGVAIAFFIMGAAALMFALSVKIIVDGFKTIGTITAEESTKIVLGISNMITTLTAILPLISTAVVTLLISIAEALLDKGEQIKEIIIKLCSLIWDSISEFINTNVTGIGELLLTIISLLTEYTPKIVTAISGLILAMLQAIVGEVPKFIQVGIDLMAALIDGIGNSITQLSSTLHDNMVKVATVMSEELTTLGPDIALGILKGICNGITKNVKNIKNVAKTIIDEIKKELGVHSPSKKTEWIGEMLGVGLEKGWQSKQNGFNKGLASSAKNSLKVISDAWEKQKAKLSGVGDGILAEMTPDLTNAFSQYDTTSMNETIQKQMDQMNFGEINFPIDQGSFDVSNMKLSDESLKGLAGFTPEINDYIGEVSNPVITPTVDLSNVENSVGDIDKLYSGTSIGSMNSAVANSGALGIDAAASFDQNKFNAMNANGTNTVNNETVNTMNNYFTINGAEDPDAVADAVADKLQFDKERSEAVWA